MRGFRILVLVLLGSSAALVLAGSPDGEAIVEAAKEGRVRRIRSILAAEPEQVHIRDAMGYTALHWAAIRAHWTAFGVLIKADAPVDAIGGDGGSPLHWACHHDRADKVVELIDRSADLDLANKWGRTPLHVAARRGCAAVATLLLERGADPNARTKEGWTPLHVAYMSGHQALVEVLLAGGASATISDEEGKLPEAMAMVRPQPISIDSSRLAEYIGEFAISEWVSAEVWIEKGGLRFMEFAPDQLYPIGQDVFFCKQEPWKVIFHRDEAGEIDHVNIHYLRRTVTGKRLRAEFAYVGSEQCRSCHSGPEQGQQYIKWLGSRHGLAYWRLATGWAKFLASLREDYQDIIEPISERRCLECHYTGASELSSRYAETFSMQEGVGCETCHGPGSAYLDLEVMSDRDKFIANGGIIPDQQTCRRCHGNQDFDFEEMFAKIAHPKPAG